jgi:transposase
VNKKTTRTKKYTETPAYLYVAFELGSPNWKLAFTTGLGQEPRMRTIEARNTETIKREIEAAKKRFKLSEQALVVSCYEAGRDGFWLHRYLIANGIENLVVDSSSIEVNRRKRRAKTDRLDAKKLSKMLVRFHSHGEEDIWKIVRVPSPEDEDRRQIHREKKALEKEIQRTINRIRGLLAAQGVRLNGSLKLSDDRIAAIRLWDKSPLPEKLKRRISRNWEQVVFLKKQLAEIKDQRREEMSRGEEPDIEKIKRLRSLKSIGEESSWVMVREFFGWRKFNNGGEVGSLAGLTGTPFDSGAQKREQGISKAGNRHIRGVAIELAWSWMRFQPNSILTKWFNERFASGGKVARKIGIVAVARKLLIALWEFVQMGVIPEGAEFKATV